MTMRQLVLLAALVALLGMPPVASAASAPPGFIGISTQNPANDADYQLMQEAGVKSLRLPLFWMSVERVSPYLVPPDWSEFDQSVAMAAAHRMRVLPFVWGTPAWVAPQPRVEPPMGARWARAAWASFLRRAVRRYGSGGSFWREHSALPYLPIRTWEVWNEENIVSFSSRSNPERFARLLRIAGRVIHRNEPGARVILGGLFGRPLQIPPNIGSGDFLNRVYLIPGMRRYFDGVALHPYVADVSAMRGEIRDLRRVMRRHHDAATPLYVTELGWGSDSHESRWERGIWGQARNLNRAFAMLTSHRRSWRIGGVWWFSLADIRGGCQFCDSAGLLTGAREAKPAWYRFNAWTGGDAGTVPRAAFGH